MTSWSWLLSKTVSDQSEAMGLPQLWVLSVSLKSLACTRPRDIPYGTRVLRLIWHKRRWRCKELTDHGPVKGGL